MNMNQERLSNYIVTCIESKVGSKTNDIVEMFAVSKLKRKDYSMFENYT